MSEERKVKLYAKWIFCIKEHCDEGYGGKCHHKNISRTYPDDGKCYYPDYFIYDIAVGEFGAYEMEE